MGSSTNSILLPLIIATLVVVGAPFVSSTVDFAEKKMAAEVICNFQSLKTCESLFRGYAKNFEKSKFDRSLARYAGHHVCFADFPTSAAVCAKLGHVLEKDALWTEAVDAYDRACTLGHSNSCKDWLTLLTGGGRLKEALAGAQALCQSALAASSSTEPEEYCYLTGVIARQMKEKASAEWAFYQSCYKSRMPDSCVALGLSYLAQRKRPQATEAMKKGCDYGMPVACANQKSLEKSAPLLAESLATIVGDHRKWRMAFAQLKGKVTPAQLAKANSDLQAIGARYRDFKGGSNEDAMQVRDLFVSELTLEQASISARKPASLAQVAAAQRKADAAFARLR